MPREGVPYPSREISSLKCQIDALNRKIDELMKSVNGVQGDGQGNVSLISGDPALVINNDQVHNEIELTLDPSLLPAAVVSSVNGQTGAVAIEAADVPASGGSDVQTELNAHATDIGNLFNALGAEATARQNADSALQTNINAVQAGIPAAAAAAVAADPTVAQLVVDLGDKVDTADVSTVQDPDTIAKRNGSGRLVAADPASGATDKTLVTANWVSQTGDNAPNNLIHRSGDESVTGLKQTAAPWYGIMQKVNSAPGYKMIFRSKSNTLDSVTNVCFGRVYNRIDNTLVSFNAIYRIGNLSFSPQITADKTIGLYIGLTVDGYIEIWCSNSRYNAMIDVCMADNNSNFKVPWNEFDVIDNVNESTKPTADNVNYRYFNDVVIS